MIITVVTPETCVFFFSLKPLVGPKVSTDRTDNKHDGDGSENVIWKWNFTYETSRFCNQFLVIQSRYAWKMCSNCPRMKLEQALGAKEDKIEHLSSYADVVHTTAKQVISRRRKNENVFKMSKDEICTCQACKNTVFHCQICKFMGFLLPSSSWLLKLPIAETKSFHIFRWRSRFRPRRVCLSSEEQDLDRTSLFWSFNGSKR